MRDLNTYRIAYRPKIPEVLMHPAHFIESDTAVTQPEIRALFPNISHDAVLTLSSGQKLKPTPLRVGVIFSGGQAPGGHTVIAALFDFLQSYHPSSELIGILRGPEGLIRSLSRILTRDEIEKVRNTGGFELLGTSRKKIESEEEFQRAEAFVKELRLDGLVVIGGDDSNTNAALLAERFAAHSLDCAVVGVPKTIDGDLKNRFLPISFGFDTACKTYAEFIGNLAKDIVSSRKYYFFVRLMGRAASHITLECALQTNPNLALISEEIKIKKTTLSDVVEQIVQLIVERAAHNKNYGLVLIPEGLIEALDDVNCLISEINKLFLTKEFLELQQPTLRLSYAKEHVSPEALACLNLFPVALEEQLVYERDSHGNVPVSQIETEKLLVLLVQEEMKRRYPKTTFSPLSTFYGYEGRSAFPTNFDCTLCDILGRVAGLLVAQKKNGYMSAVMDISEDSTQWRPIAIPLTSLMHLEVRKGVKKPVIEKTVVDLNGSAFKAFSDIRNGCRLEDYYQSNGPIQFFGPYADVLQLPRSL